MGAQASARNRGTAPLSHAACLSHRCARLPALMGGFKDRPQNTDSHLGIDLQRNEMERDSPKGCLESRPTLWSSWERFASMAYAETLCLLPGAEPPGRTRCSWVSLE